MTEKERFQYEMMDTINLANACQKVKQKIDNLLDDKRMANHRAEYKRLDGFSLKIRKAKSKLREMRKILKSRQMKLF